MCASPAWLKVQHELRWVPTSSYYFFKKIWCYNRSMCIRSENYIRSLKVTMVHKLFIIQYYELQQVSQTTYKSIAWTINVQILLIGQIYFHRSQARVFGKHFQREQTSNLQFIPEITRWSGTTPSALGKCINMKV